MDFMKASNFFLLTGLVLAGASLVVHGQDAAAPAKATVVLKADQPGAVVNRNIYGHFAEHLGRCIYEGVWVGEDSPIPNTRGIRNDTVAALKKLNIPVLRWPGGCFADEYHWKDGIGPRDKRPKIINTHWGSVVENNHFGTHEFLDLCEQVGAQPYICGNVGSGSPQEMMEWVEYITSDADSPMANLRRQNGHDKAWKLPYFGVGNESWGCGGNMRPEFYADQFRRYNTFVKNYSGNSIYRIACGSNVDDYNWTETLMSMAGRQMNGLSLHYYTIPTGNWSRKGAATQFSEDDWHATLLGTLRMDELISKHSLIMDKYDARKRVGMIVDEWGTWYDVEPGTNPGFLYQQNTLRDALVAALNFHIFQAHADRVAMANIAQTINVLQAMILTDKEKLLVTPTYHVFEMFKIHQGARTLPVDLISPDYVRGGRRMAAISVSATKKEGGPAHMTLANTDPNKPVEVEISLRGLAAKSVSGRILTASEMNAHNTFAAPATVAPKTFEGAKITGESLRLTMPAKSVVVLALE
jgi:alpha-N-arabinofuranosidase